MCVDINGAQFAERESLRTRVAYTYTLAYMLAYEYVYVTISRGKHE